MDRLARSPSGPGIFLKANADDTWYVFTGSRKMRVTVSPNAELSGLRPVQEVVLNEALNEVIAQSCRTVGELAGQVGRVKVVQEEGVGRQELLPQHQGPGAAEQVRRPGRAAHPARLPAGQGESRGACRSSCSRRDGLIFCGHGPGGFSGAKTTIVPSRSARRRRARGIDAHLVGVVYRFSVVARFPDVMSFAGEPGAVWCRSRRGRHVAGDQGIYVLNSINGPQPS